MNRYCISKEYTIKDTIECIESCHDRVVVVVDEEDKVLGIVSQGDIIRALISGKSLFTQVKNIIRPNFYYLTSRDLQKAYALFRKHHITLLPIVDNDFHIVEVINMNDIYDFMEGR